MVTEVEAVEMYALHFAARHRGMASMLARESANAFKDKGDFRGHKIWNDVADAIDRHEQARRPNPDQASH